MLKDLGILVIYKSSEEVFPSEVPYVNNEKPWADDPIIETPD